MSGSAPSSEELLELAVGAARMAGELLAERFLARERRGIASKSTPTDLVSEADLAAERAIRELLSSKRPDDGFLGEEGGEHSGGSGLRWVVDPLDGTINFLFGIPQWCVSIAVQHGQTTIAGVVFDPNRDELFTAVRGGVPTLNGELVSASDRGDLSAAMVATGLAYDAQTRAEQAQVLTRLVPRVRDLRRFGSAALDLVWTAAGRYDAYFERSVKPWDIAAGQLICECAGLGVLELPESGLLPGGILTAPEALCQPLFEIVS